MPDDLSGYDLPVMEELQKAKFRHRSDIQDQISQILRAYAKYPTSLSVEYHASVDHYLIMSPDKQAWVLRGDVVRAQPDWHPIRDLEKTSFRGPLPEPGVSGGPKVKPHRGGTTFADKVIQWTNLDWLFDRCDPPSELDSGADSIAESILQLQEMQREVTSQVDDLREQYER